PFCVSRTHARRALPSFPTRRSSDLGRATAVVVATGAGTEAGRSMATAQRAGAVSGVERRLAQITRTTLPIALGSAGAVLAAGLSRGRGIRETLGAAVGLAVASVPEG